jgi:DNA-binding NarL/FixJ family response regulator
MVGIVIATERRHGMNNPTRSRTVRVVLLHAAAAATGAGDELAAFLAIDPTIAWLGMRAADATAVQSLSTAGADVAVVDLRGSDSDSGQLLRQVLAASPATQIVVLCDSGDADAAQAALAGGAAGCLTRQTDPLAVLRAINEVMRGQMHLSPTGQRAIRGTLDPAHLGTKRR